MTATTLNSRNLAPTTSEVGVALQELITAARHLLTALWATSSQRTADIPQTLIASQEADNLRSMAADLMLKDPRFANELFAAADRHEYAAMAAVR
jgi:hypothetical protein